jgi:hypothetical protein
MPDSTWIGGSSMGRLGCLFPAAGQRAVVYAWVRLCDDDPKYYWHYRVNRHGAFLDSAQLRCDRQIKGDLVSSPNAVVSCCAPEILAGRHPGWTRRQWRGRAGLDSNSPCWVIILTI